MLSHTAAQQNASCNNGTCLHWREHNCNHKTYCPLSLCLICVGRFCFLAAPRMPILCCVMQLESHESLSIIPQGNKSNHPPLLLIGRAMQLLPLPSCTLVIFSPRCHCQCKICCCEKIIDEAAAAAAISPCAMVVVVLPLLSSAQP
jgi:hypothetical protein